MFFISLCSTFLINPRRNNLFDKYHSISGEFLLNRNTTGTSTLECSDLTLDTQVLDLDLTTNCVNISPSTQLSDEN